MCVLYWILVFIISTIFTYVSFINRHSISQREVAFKLKWTSSSFNSQYLLRPNPLKKLLSYKLSVICVKCTSNKNTLYNSRVFKCSSFLKLVDSLFSIVMIIFAFLFLSFSIKMFIFEQTGSEQTLAENIFWTSFWWVVNLSK